MKSRQQLILSTLVAACGVFGMAQAQAVRVINGPEMNGRNLNGLSLNGGGDNGSFTNGSFTNGGGDNGSFTNGGGENGKSFNGAGEHARGGRVEIRDLRVKSVRLPDGRNVDLR